MQVQNISGVHATRIVAVLEDLLERARADQFTSLAFVAEQHRDDPLIGVVGLYRERPTKLLGELSMMKAKLIKYANRKRQPQDFQQSAL
jgi:hypothetical protein